MRPIALMPLMLTVPAPVQAQIDTPAQPPAIHVTGRGRVATPPNVAVIDYWITGEGETPDAASAALAAKQEAVTRGLASLLGPRTAISGGNVVVIETRGPECRGAEGYNVPPRLSEGACAPTGFIARLQGNVRTDAVAKAGTAAGLAARLGASDARLQQFLLVDGGEARRRAVAQALADARASAAALAAGAGARLGPILSVRDQGQGGEIIVTGSRASAPPPPPPPPPPVEIELTPRPIETEAQVFVSYAILP